MGKDKEVESRLSRKAYDREYYLKNKLTRQQQMDTWLAAHPGWKQRHNREYYLRRIGRIV
jgi:hypothetical protein